MNSPDPARLAADIFDAAQFEHRIVPCSSPAHIRAAADLYGVVSAPLAGARVLELGCGSGENLLAFAAAFPRTEVVGVDVSAEAVAAGMQRVQALGLHNLRLQCLDLSSLDEHFGQFDYIIANAMYGRLPPGQSDELLRICRQNLSADGLAFVSYNTYPGCKGQDVLREAMLLHGRNATSGEEMLGSARAALGLFIEGIDQHNPLASVLTPAANRARQQSDEDFARDYLIGAEQACYFVAFADRVQQFGLCHLGDAKPAEEWPAKFGAGVAMHNGLLALGQPASVRQQYLDFAVGRASRRSLLMHHEFASVASGLPDPARLRGLYVAADLRNVPLTAAEMRNGPNYHAYLTHDGRRVATGDMTEIHVAQALHAAWPAAVAFEELAAAVPARDADTEGEAHRRGVLAALESLFKWDVLRLRTAADRCPEPAGLTLVTGLREAAQAAPTRANELVWFNVWHEPITLPLTPRWRFLLPHLDGKNDYPQLCALLGDALARGLAGAADDNAAPPADRAGIGATVAGLIEALRERGAIHASSDVWQRHYAGVLADADPARDNWLGLLDPLVWHGLRARRLQAAGSAAARAANAATTAKAAAALTQKDSDEYTRLFRAGLFEDAAALMQKLLQKTPRNARAHRMLASAWEELGRFADARIALLAALQLEPLNADAHTLLGLTLQKSSAAQQADRAFYRARAIDPAHAMALSNIALRLWKQRRRDEAECYFKRALAVNPLLASAQSNYGSLLWGQGRLAEAEAAYRKALAANPNFFPGYSNLLFSMSHQDDISVQVLTEEHRKFGARAQKMVQRLPYGPGARDRSPTRALRVGFVSADLRNHAVANFLEPAWNALDRNQFEIHAYSNTEDEDATSERLKQHARVWRRVTGLTDAALAAQIRADRIDVLFDLSGHTAGNRLLAFAQKPAPIQISWLGYPQSTGIAAMDYYLMDKHAVPLGDLASQFVEKLVYLPSLSAFRPSEHSGPITPLPALTKGHVTFASFNRTSKIGVRTVAIWSKVLHSVPGSRMLIGDVRDDATRASLLERFAENGIEAARLTFRARMAMAEYLACHAEADIALDTYPYTGGTTTNHSLWMGVPVLTMKGEARVSAQTAGILSRNGLHDWICTSEDELVAKAIEWAGDTARLAQLRAGMRERLNQTPSRQAAEVVRGLEAAMRRMWERWAKGLPAESFTVGDAS